MKANKFLAAILAVALSFNFASCSDDDPDEGGSGSGSATKRLTKVFVQAPASNTNNETVFQYDNKGRVTEMDITNEHKSGNVYTGNYSYSYNGNELTVVNVSSYNSECDTATFTYNLNDKGYVISGSELNVSYHRKYTFEYTDDYMTLGTDIVEEDKMDPYRYERNKIIADGLILPEDWDAVEYTDIPNKGNLFFHYANNVGIFEDFEYCELYLANLLGKAPKYLPKSVTDSREGSWYFSYKLDDDGYPTTITINFDYADNPSIITCTYESVK